MFDESHLVSSQSEINLNTSGLQVISALHSRNTLHYSQHFPNNTITDSLPFTQPLVIVYVTMV